MFHLEHLAKREELWKARQSAQVAPVESKRSDKRGHRSEGFASDTADATGVSKSTVNRATSRAKTIPGDIRAIIKGTHLDRGVLRAPGVRQAVAETIAPRLWRDNAERDAMPPESGARQGAVPEPRWNEHRTENGGGPYRMAALGT